MNFPVTYDALQPYLLAKGKERACYRNPVNTNTVIKLSHCSCARQSLRELTYFEVLKRRKVPATHIPFFVGRVNIPGYVGIEQQLICDFDGSPSKSLFYYLWLYRGFDGKARLTMPRFFMPWSLGWVMGSEGLSRRA